MNSRWSLQADMVTGIYSFAGQTVQIRSLFPAVHRQCRDYACTGAPDITVTTTADLIRREQERSARQDAQEGKAVRSVPEDQLESLAVYRLLAEEMVDRDTLLMHGSAISVDGQAYLFTAQSGTGKSTHTRLWRELLGSRAVMVNDDKPLVKITDTQVLACGTPWDGKHHLNTNVMVPLKAICILRRGTSNSIRRIPAWEAVPTLLQQTYRPEDAQKLLRSLSVLDTAARRLRFFVLECNMDPEAAQISYQALHLEEN